LLFRFSLFLSILLFSTACDLRDRTMDVNESIDAYNSVDYTDSSDSFKATNYGYVTTLTWQLDDQPAYRDFRITRTDLELKDTSLLVEFQAPGEQTSYQDRSTRPNEVYDYTLQGCGESECDQLGKLRIKGREFLELTPPLAIQPDNPVIETDGEFTITWQASENGYAYNLYATTLDSTMPTAFAPIATELFTTSHQATGLKPGSRYAFYLQSCDPNGNCSERSNLVAIGLHIHPLETPVIHQPTIDGSRVRLAWNDIPLATYYEVSRSIGDEYPAFSSAAALRGSIYNDYLTLPSSHTPAYYKVRACNKQLGCSNFSDQQTTSLTQPAGYHALNAAATESTETTGQTEPAQLKLDADFRADWLTPERLTLDLRMAQMPSDSARINWRISCVEPQTLCDELDNDQQGEVALQQNRQLLHIDFAPEQPKEAAIHHLQLKVCTANACTKSLERLIEPQPPAMRFGNLPVVETWGEEFILPVNHLPRDLQAEQLQLTFDWLDEHANLLDRRQLQVVRLLDHALVALRPDLPSGGRQTDRVRLSLYDNNQHQYLVRDSLHILGRACATCGDPLRLRLIEDATYDAAFFAHNQVCATSGLVTSCTQADGRRGGSISGFSQLVSGYSINCGKLADTWLCWGQNNGGVMPGLPRGEPFDATPFPYPARRLFLAADYPAICAIEGDERHLYCWGEMPGNAQFGATGDHPIQPRTQILDGQEPLRDITRVAFVGSHAVCATGADLVCWGREGATRVAPTRLLEGDDIRLPGDNLPALAAIQGENLHYWEESIFNHPPQTLTLGAYPDSMAITRVGETLGAWLAFDDNPAVSLSLDWFEVGMQTASQPIRNISGLFADKQRWCFTSTGGALYCGE